MALGDIAATLGVPVFACTREKKPLDKGGFHNATRNATVIIDAFNRPGAEMIGMPTGIPSGLIVVDVDVRPQQSGMDWLEENRECLPETRTHKTRTGGLHLIFRRPEGFTIRNSASKIAPHVDVRGDGGYVIIPPSPGYSVADNTPPAEMPQWLIKACVAAEEPADAIRAPSGPINGSTSYGLKALEEECKAVRAAPIGRQEKTLNDAALKLGALVAGGHLVESVAKSELIAAGSAFANQPGKKPWTHNDITEKVARGMKDGAARPRGPEPQRPKTNGHTRPEAPREQEPALDTREFTGDEPPPLAVIYFDDIKPKLDTADFVEGLLIEAAMSVIYGQSNSGKTFFMSDLSLHVAAGKQWCGREVAHGAVIWLAMEGAYGISNRIAAWREEKGIDASTLPFAVVPTALNLLDPAADTENLIQTIKIVAAKLKLPVKLVVVDTLSRAIAGGNENSPEDMGALVTNGTRIQQATGAHVAWIHHSGKDEAKGARGHSLLRAASDTEIEISAEGPVRVARVTKQREMECEGDFSFTLKVVELGLNGRGKPVTSCVVVHSGQTAGAVPDRQTRLRGDTARALEVLTNVVASSGKTGFTGLPSGANSVPEKWWRDRFYESAKPGSTEDAKQRAFRRAADELVNRRIVGMACSRVWVVSQVYHPMNHRSESVESENYSAYSSNSGQFTGQNPE